MRKPIGTVALIAFGAALLLMLSWGHQTSDQAEAQLEFDLGAYKCYSAIGYPAVHEWVFLDDQFTEKDAWVDRPVGLCNPASKEGGTNGGAAGNFVEENHLVCFRIFQNGLGPGHVVVDNQFGTQELEVGRAERLCVRSEKGNNITTGSAGMHDFVPNLKCYNIRPTRGYDTNRVFVEDQYQEKVSRVHWPTSLCVPVWKGVDDMGFGGVAGPQPLPLPEQSSVLVCYQIFQRPGLRFETVQNQFGTQHLLVYRAKSLCVPSFKAVECEHTVTATCVELTSNRAWAPAADGYRVA